jgi:hypothetical protein
MGKWRGQNRYPRFRSGGKIRFEKSGQHGGAPEGLGIAMKGQPFIDPPQGLYRLLHIVRVSIPIPQGIDDTVPVKTPDERSIQQE